jgi:hypothetical protein
MWRTDAFISIISTTNSAADIISVWLLSALWMQQGEKETSFVSLVFSLTLGISV